MGVEATEEKPTEVVIEEEMKGVLMCIDEVPTVKKLMEEHTDEVEELMGAGGKREVGR